MTPDCLSAQIQDNPQFELRASLSQSAIDRTSTYFLCFQKCRFLRQWFGFEIVGIPGAEAPADCMGHYPNALRSNEGGDPSPQRIYRVMLNGADTTQQYSFRVCTWTENGVSVGAVFTYMP